MESLSDTTATTPVVAVDGVAASGKGTVAKLVAQRLGWRRLDSGAFYRMAAVAIRRLGIDPGHDGESAAEVIKASQMTFTDAGESILNGEDVSDEIRRGNAGEMASVLSALPLVRDAVNDALRAHRTPPGLVIDGRDMGSEVFPDALVKVFLTASARERAERRKRQLMEHGDHGHTVDSLMAEIGTRDERDGSREHSPMKPADDAVVVDTGGIDPASVTQRVMDLLSERGIGHADERRGRSLGKAEAGFAR